MRNASIISAGSSAALIHRTWSDSSHVTWYCQPRPHRRHARMRHVGSAEEAAPVSAGVTVSLPPPPRSAPSPSS
eukprot:7001493-Prymnesium_polylepis.1